MYEYYLEVEVLAMMVAGHALAEVEVRQMVFSHPGMGVGHRTSALILLHPPLVSWGASAGEEVQDW